MIMSVVFRLPIFIAMFLLCAACGIGNTVTTTLPAVDAMDDEAATMQGTSVQIFVLTNDLQDDDLVTSIDNVSVGDAEIDTLTFPEQITYTAPDGFIGTATFDYSITGLGTEYDYTTSDTATVTVLVTEGPPPVRATNDMVVTEIDQPVEIDVLQNDMQDSDMIDAFSQADVAPGAEAGTVELLENDAENELDRLRYTPALGFEGTAIFTYDIVGVGDAFEDGSMDTGTVTVEVTPPLAPQVIVQFEDGTGETMLEGIVIVLDPGADSTTVFVSPFETVSQCFATNPGINVPVASMVFVFDGPPVDVAGVCESLELDNTYTISVVPGDPYAIECELGLADPSRLGCP